MIGWVFFRADTLSDALGYLRALASLAGRSEPPETVLALHFTADVRLAMLAGIVGSIPWIRDLGARLDSMSLSAITRTGVETAVNGALIFMFLVALTQLAAGTYNPFIYFRF